MANLNYPYTLTNGTTADASQLMSNLAAVQAVVNGNIEPTNVAVTGKVGRIASASDLALTGAGQNVVTTSFTIAHPNQFLIAVGVIDFELPGGTTATCGLGGTLSGSNQGVFGTAGIGGFVRGPSVVLVHEYPLLLQTYTLNLFAVRSVGAGGYAKGGSSIMFLVGSLA